MNEAIIIKALECALGFARIIKEFIDSNPAVDGKIKDRAYKAIAAAQEDLASLEADEEAELAAIRKKIGVR